MKNLDPKAERLIEAFPYDKVRKIMVVLDWTWYESPEPPTVYKMKSVVRDLFRSLREHDTVKVGTGGFYVSRWGDPESDNWDYLIEFIGARLSTEEIE